ncbi:MAG: DUF3445 domain-containing protein [Thalassovita sp.]
MKFCFQNEIPFNPFVSNRLPGIAPLEPKSWLLVDDAFDCQMATRDHLISTQPDAVLASCEGSQEAQAELLELVLGVLSDQPNYHIGVDYVRRPDGVEVALNRAAPMATLGRLIQEDLCVLQPHGSQHVLTAAVLCFPASWTLAEKIGRPLSDIHIPVAAYTEELAKRVQRLFDAIHPDRPLWRSNCLWYDSPELFQPRSVSDPRPATAASLTSELGAEQGAYLRSERQCLLRLPKTQAAVFSIHTFVLKAAAARQLKLSSGQSVQP